MDFLRLPVALRQSLLTNHHVTSTLVRCYSAETNAHDAPPLLTLSSSTLNSYAISNPPTLQNLKTATSYFQQTKPSLLYSSANFRSFPPSSFPEVAFLGRSNVGKSSLLNALFGHPNQPIAYVSKRPGKTITMNGYGVGGEGFTTTQSRMSKDATSNEAAWKRWGKGGLVVVDMPGYGAGSRGEWGGEIMKYLEKRKQLRRTYVLIDTEHGLKNTDVQLLVHLRQQGIAHQVVLSKVDKILYPHAKAPGREALHNRLMRLKELQDGIRRELDEASQDAGGRTSMGDIMCCSSEKSLDVKRKSVKIGIDELRWSVLTACGLENQDAGKKARRAVNTAETEFNSIEEDDKDAGLRALEASVSSR